MNAIDTVAGGVGGAGKGDRSGVASLAWILGSCAVVLTGWVLGAGWLGVGALGVPLGLWIVLAVVGVRSLLAHQRAQAEAARQYAFPLSEHTTAIEPRPAPAATGSPGTTGVAETPETGDAQPAPAELTLAGAGGPSATLPGGGQEPDATFGPAAQHGAGGPNAPAIHVPMARRVLASLAEAGVGLAGWALEGSPSWLAGLRDRPGVSGAAFARPLRVGTVLEPRDAHALRAAEGVLPVEWARLDRHPGERDAVWRRLALDAVVEAGPGGHGLRVRTPEDEVRAAGWYDWAEPLPLSYASLFPQRVDCGRLTIEAFNWDDSNAIALLRVLAETAGLLGRYPTRVGVGDRLRGREAVALLPGTPLVADAALDACVRGLVACLERRSPPPGPIDHAAERVLATVLAWPTCPMEHGERARSVRAMFRLGVGEGETALRAGAAAFAAGNLVLGYGMLLEGYERLAVVRPEPLVDPMDFLLSDVAFNTGGPETTGRLAAGIAYTASLAGPGRAAYVLDDVRDEVMAAPWLEVRPDDRELILGVIDTLAETGSRVAA